MGRWIVSRQTGALASSRDIVLSGLVLVGFSQLIGVLLLDLGRDSAGHPLQVSLINALMLQVPLYLCGLLVLAAAWSVVNAAVPRFQRVTNTLGVTLFGSLAVVSHIDFGMQRFRGERISWAQLSNYARPDGLSTDWINAVLEQPLPLAATVATITATLWLLSHVLRRGQHPLRESSTASARSAVLYALAGVACYLPTRFAYQPQRDLALSPRAVLLQPLLARQRRWPQSQETAGRTNFREAIDVTARGGWLSDSFPLWRTGAHTNARSFGAAREDPPDIVLFMIESLRGHDVGWGFGQRADSSGSRTPHLDSLARIAVTFPHYIANGDPSPRGFITLHTGAWEHEHDFIIANHPDIAIDALPVRLKTAGYHTVGLWGGNPSFDNQLTWARRWYDDVVFQLPGNQIFYFRTTPDHVLMDRAIASIARHDSTRSGKPLFMMVASARTHTPFTLEADAEVATDRPPSDDRQRRYDLVLRNVDAGIGRVVASLRKRDRWRNTVIIVVGDHSDRTDEVDDVRWRGLPTDAAVATAAFIFGPPALIGQPRVLTFPASHADVLPTVLAWLGDTTPVTTLGRDLFDTAATAAREAVAINGRGYRLDRGGYTLLVDRNNTGNFFAWRSFASGNPSLLPLASTSFASDEPERLTNRIRYWSHLVDENRVRPPQRR